MIIFTGRRMHRIPASSLCLWKDNLLWYEGNLACFQPQISCYTQHSCHAKVSLNLHLLLIQKRFMSVERLWHHNQSCYDVRIMTIFLQCASGTDVDLFCCGSMSNHSSHLGTRSYGLRMDRAESPTGCYSNSEFDQSSVWWIFRGEGSDRLCWIGKFSCFRVLKLTHLLFVFGILPTEYFPTTLLALKPSIFKYLSPPPDVHTACALD